MSASTAASASAPAPLRFPTGWCATDLGAHRPCEFTYEVYPLESLPSLDPGTLDGTFRWLSGAGAPDGDADHRDDLASVEASLAPLGLRLPADFRTFYGSGSLCRAFDEVSVTACWSDLSGPLQSPAEDGARLIRFLRDQQDCVIWYLYLRPSGETFVVCSHLELEFDGQELNGTEAAEFRAAAADSLVRCASTFEEFAFRFVVENELWMHLNTTNPDATLAPHLQKYLDHYAAAAS
ncbi:hypothetical protein ACGFYU_01370 [Streptomyces sp. NPDC048337]|uniref:hypothetical protein n=1 Tax=Streptomyces sp. NPDC048337 TaxID=3365535 RepID=UPI0037138ABC